MKLRVRWADSDPAGRINFPRYFDYMEDGEAELMRSVGLSYGQLPAGYGVPRVHTECTFKKILEYDVPFTMRVTIGKLGNTSIRYQYQFLTEGDPPELAAEGSMTVVVIKDGRPIEIPSRVARRPFGSVRIASWKSAVHARLLCVVGVSLWSATTLAHQATASADFPAEFRAHLQTGRFDIVSSIRGLPLGVRHELQTLFGGETLDIAEAGAPFRARGESANAPLPSRRLVAAGCSYEDCLVYYQRGGRGARTWRVLLLHWTPDATILEWGGNAPGGLTTFAAVRTAVLSGTIKRSTGPW